MVVIKTKPHAALHYGGQLAAPVFKEVATKVYAMYVQKKQNNPVITVPDSSVYTVAGNSSDVSRVFHQLQLGNTSAPEDQEWSAVDGRGITQAAKPLAMQKNTMPDVRNMTLKDALFALESGGYSVNIKGKGKVVAQDILPGTAVRKGQSVTLLLNE